MQVPKLIRRPAFTLIELLVALAIGALLLALMTSAAQQVREAASRVRCQNNLRQLALAAQHFHENNGTLPPFCGISPAVGTCGLRPNCNRAAVYGSWFAHLLPYAEQDNLYRAMAVEVAAKPFNDRIQLTSGTNCRTMPDRNYTGGHARNYSVCDVYPTYEEHGIWLPAVRGTPFAMLRCPSDPTVSEPAVIAGWGVTSYLANFNILDSGQRIPANEPRWALPPSLRAITDGLSNTVLFGEGYAECDGWARLALYSYNYHNFGIDWFQNPNTLRFQVRPLPRLAPQCSEGQECCDSWRAQTAHSAMNVALADGSVRTVGPGISQLTWDRALLPRDGNPLGNDW